MENIRKEKTSPGMTLADRVRKLEGKKDLKEKAEKTKKETKQFKWPVKWRRKFKQSKKKKFGEKILVLFLNKKNIIEPPKFMPIFDGNMIVWKDKPYEFDPRAVLTVGGVRGNPQTYLIKEIDRRPVMNKDKKIVYSDAAVSNMDADEIKARGDSTDSDSFLIKAVLKAFVAKGASKKKVSATVLIVIIVIVVGVLYFLLKGG